MFSIFMKKFLYRKSHYKENCMKKVMISLSMLVFVLVSNSCDADSKAGLLELVVLLCILFQLIMIPFLLIVQDSV